MSHVSFLNREIERAQQDWLLANQHGDKNAMNAAHQRADLLRNQGGTLRADQDTANTLALKSAISHSGVSIALSNASVTELNKGIIQAKVNYQYAQARGDQQAMNAARMLADNYRSLGGTISSSASLTEAQKQVQSNRPATSNQNTNVNVTISRPSTEELNKGIYQAKLDYTYAQARGDQRSMQEAAQRAQNYRALGGTISTDASLEQTRQIVNNNVKAGNSPSQSNLKLIPLANYRALPGDDGSYTNQVPDDTSSSDTTSNQMYGPGLVNPQSGMGVDSLNDIIRNDRKVYTYYNDHPDAVGPNGESADTMKEMSHSNAEASRGYGGTVGVPTILVGGIMSDKSTWYQMLTTINNNSSMVGTWTATYKNLGPEYSNETTEHKTKGYEYIQHGINGDHPLIDVEFSHSTTSSWKNETAYLDPALKDVEAKYGTSHVNIVAHSQGGLVALNYAEQHLDSVHVDKFVTLDTPFDGGNTPISDLRYGYANIQLGIDKNKYMTDSDKQTYNAAHPKAIQALQGTNVWSVYGAGDDAVHQSSAFALSNLPLTNFQTKVYQGLDHRHIHDSYQVINDVNYFLFGGRR